MKKLFMLLSLLVIGIIGVGQTYAYTSASVVTEYNYNDAKSNFIWSIEIIGGVEKNYAYGDDSTQSKAGLDMFGSALADAEHEKNYLKNQNNFVLEDLTNGNVVVLENASFAWGGSYPSIFWGWGETHQSELLGYTANRVGEYVDITQIKASYSFGGVLFSDTNNIRLTLYEPGTDYLNSNYDLELKDLTDGQSLTAEQWTIYDQMYNTAGTVILELEDGTTYDLNFRSDFQNESRITEINEPEGRGGYSVLNNYDDIYIYNGPDATPANYTGTFSLYMNFPPSISGAGVFVTDYDNPATVADVQSTLTATDDPDGDLTANITVFEDNYTGNENILGSHDIIFQVEDAAGNIAQYTVTVEVVDVTPAVITLNGDATITKSIGDAPCSYAGAQATDNVDGVVQLDGVCNVDTNTIGTYTIEYNYTDTSGNVSTPVIVTVEVVDNQAPYIENNVTSITTFNSQDLTLNTVLASLNILDDHDLTFDGSYTVLEDNYTGRESIEGSYTVVIEATDAAGNTMQETITINVIDDLPPVISASEYLLTSEEIAAMTPEEIKAHIESRN